jgi:hypothetical protein
VALVRTNVMVESIDYIVRVTRVVEPHDVTLQKTAFFIVNAAKTSSLAYYETVHLYLNIKKCNLLF